MLIWDEMCCFQTGPEDSNGIKVDKSMKIITCGISRIKREIKNPKELKFEYFPFVYSSVT